MPRRRSTTYHLLDVLLDGKLEAFVTTRRAEGASWRLISFEVWDATGKRFPVSHEVLRKWFPDDVNGGEGAAA